MEAADDGPVALVLGPQRIEAMGADILEALQLGAEPLHEDRSRRQRGAEPIAVLLDIVREAEERPGETEAALLVRERKRVDQGARPVGGEGEITAKGHCAPKLPSCGGSVHPCGMPRQA